MHLIISKIMKYKLYIFAILLTIILDQATKYYTLSITNDKNIIEITNFFNIVRLWNFGMSFGIMNYFGTISNYIFLVLNSIIIIFIIFMLIKSTRNEELLFAFALSLIIGGGIGNLIDRIMHGAVADFIDLHIMGYHWPAFNIADSAVCIGGILIIIDYFKEKKNEKII